MTAAGQTDGQVATVFERHYLLEVGALANSLWEYGFRDEFVVGYRGELTFKASDARPEGSNQVFSTGEGRRVRFKRLDTDWHLTNRKPYFLRDVWPAVAAVLARNPGLGWAILRGAGER